jgi:hypothetical protein
MRTDRGRYLPTLALAAVAVLLPWSQASALNAAPTRGARGRFGSTWVAARQDFDDRRIVACRLLLRTVTRLLRLQRQTVTPVTLNVPLRRVLEEWSAIRRQVGVCTVNDWEVQQRATAGEVVLIYLKSIAFAAALMNVLEYVIWLHGG